MRVFIVHNEYGKFSGEEAVVEAQRNLLEDNGHQVHLYQRSSNELDNRLFGKPAAFLSGIYNPKSKREIRKLVQECRPDIVHVHNVFPLISPSILPECRRMGIPIVMTVHNYRLVCPNGLHMPKGRFEVCEKCCDGREYWCVLKNCEQSYFKSLGYAVRTSTARRFGFFTKNVTRFACLTEFQCERLVSQGFPAERMSVVPNMYPADTETMVDRAGGNDCVGYVGRISPEKGIHVLLAAARGLPSIPFRLAGSYDAMPDLVSQSPANVHFCGNLNKSELSKFYHQSRLLLLCSTCFEGFPMAIVEAMAHGKPVIASRIGGIPEIVEDTETGLLFSPGNVDELAERIQRLWHRPALCRKMGQAGRNKATREYSPKTYYERLMAVYRKARDLGPARMAVDVEYDSSAAIAAVRKAAEARVGVPVIVDSEQKARTHTKVSRPERLP